MWYKLLFLLTPKAHAQQSIMGEFRKLVCPGATTNQKIADCMTQLDLKDTIVLVNVIVRIAFGLAGIVALIYLIYAAYLYMTSLGNPDAVAAAKSRLLHAALGLLIIIIAYVLVAFIFEIFGPSGATIGNPIQS